MSATMTDTHLPDPLTQADFYAGVTTKRLVAWVVDVIIITALTVMVATLPLFIGWFFFPLIFLVLSFFYRVATITSGSATWGMRLFNIQLRNRMGQPLGRSEAMLHTAAYLLASSFFIPQLISIMLMLTTERSQSLHDMLCGTAAINTPSRY